MIAYRENDMLVIDDCTDDYELRIPFPAIGAIELAHAAHTSQFAISHGSPTPWSVWLDRDSAHALAGEVNEAVAAWLYDHFPTVRRDDT